MAKRSLGHGSNETPGPVRAGGLFHFHLVAGGAHVGFVRLQLDAVFAAGIFPRNFLAVQIEVGHFGNVDDFRKCLVNRETVRLHVHRAAEPRNHVRERVAHALDVDVAAEFLAQIIAGKNQRAARVLLLAIAEKIRGEADLCLHFFFAIAVIIVRDERHDDAGFVAAGQLEGAAAVVKLVVGFPAHSVALLAFGSLVKMREADGFFRRFDQMRRKNDATGVAGPMFRIERGIIFRQNRITAVSKNTFDKIQITHEISRNEKSHLHRFLGGESGNFRADNWAQQQGDETFRRLRLRGGEREPHETARRIERQREHFAEDVFRHGELVVGNWQTTLGDVENSLRRAAVALWIMQNAVGYAVGIDDVGGKIVAVNRQRKNARQTGPVEGERAARKFCDRHVLQIVVEKSLKPLVGGAEIIPEQPVLLARLPSHRRNDFGEVRVVFNGDRRAADERELDVDVRDEMRGPFAQFVRLRMCVAFHCKKILMMFRFWPATSSFAGTMPSPTQMTTFFERNEKDFFTFQNGPTFGKVIA